MDGETNSGEQLDNGTQLQCYSCGRKLFGRVALLLPVEEAPYADEGLFQEGALAFDSLHFSEFLSQLYVKETTTMFTVAVGPVGDIVEGLLGDGD